MLLIENISNYDEDFYENIKMHNHLLKKYNSLENNNTKKIMKMSFYLKNKLATILNLENYKIIYSIYKKPFLKTKDKLINFNISHDKDIVILIYDENNPIGIDIIDTNKELKYYQSEYFTNNENNNIKDKNLFYKIWLMKEAYSKYLGKGLHSNLKNIDFLDIINNLYYIDIKFKFINIKNYKICICFQNNSYIINNDIDIISSFR